MKYVFSMPVNIFAVLAVPGELVIKWRGHLRRGWDKAFI